MNDPTVTVTEGSVTVEEVDVVHIDEDCWIFEIATKEKHPEIWGYTTFGVDLGRMEPGSDMPVQPVTQVRIHGFESTTADPWFTVVSSERYAVLLVIYKDQRAKEEPLDRDRWTIWRNKDFYTMWRENDTSSNTESDQA